MDGEGETVIMAVTEIQGANQKDLPPGQALISSRVPRVSSAVLTTCADA